MTAASTAPASPLDGIDAALAERLLAAALSSGGAYADLYFEHRSGADYVLEDVVVTSDGHLARDQQPMIRFGVSAVAEEGQQRQGGRSGGAGRFGMEFFARPGQSPEEHGREAARLAIGMLHAVEAPAGPME